MSTGLAAIHLVKESAKIVGFEILWKNAKATIIHEGQVVATLHFHSANLIVEPLDLMKTKKENWRRFEYADPAFPDNAIYYLCGMVGIENLPPPLEIT